MKTFPVPVHDVRGRARGVPRVRACGPLWVRVVVGDERRVLRKSKPVRCLCKIRRNVWLNHKSN